MTKYDSLQKEYLYETSDISITISPLSTCDVCRPYNKGRTHAIHLYDPHGKEAYPREELWP